MTPTLVFDIETVPDVAGIRKLWNLPAEAHDEAVAELALQRRRQATGSDFLQHHLQRIVAISCVMRSDEGLRVWSLGTPEEGEAELVRRFFDGIEKFVPQLVSWNGSGFDLPVLHYRALMHGLAAPRYWDLGDGDYNESRDFKFNNYLGRYHTRHLDLMDILASYVNRASAPLDDMARLCGFPGKLGMDGGQVWEAFRKGEIVSIRNYCETDVFNTHLLLQRFKLLRGHLSAKEYDAEIGLARRTVDALPGEHWRAFAAAWQ